MEVINIHKQFKKKHFSPMRRIAFSFFAVIMIGAYLLSLPICQRAEPVPFIDHFFTATSATCVTGLITHPIKEQYSLYGQIVIIILIQIGGLGFLTLLNMMYVLLKRKLTFKNRMIMQEALNQNSLADIKKYIQRVIKYTFCIEGIGACFLCFVFIPRFGISKGLYYSFFHAVSAFCNAGFDVLSSQSLIPYQTDVWLNLIISGLIISGSLGFVVWIELRHAWKHYKDNFKVFRVSRFIASLSLHTRIVFMMTSILLIGGTLLTLVLEWNNPLTLGDFSFSNKLLISFFQSVTLRTAGFVSIDMAYLRDTTKFVMSAIMFIGGSPASTAGGIKTVTFAIVCLYVYTTMRGSSTFCMMKRTISDQIVKRALSMTFISFFIVLCGLFILSISENKAFIDLMFEVFSAFATVGVTAGVTPSLTFVGKIVIMTLMYIGRIGPMTMIMIFAKKYSDKKGKDIQYPINDVFIG